LLSEVDKDFKGYWLGSQANAFFVPSLAQRLKKNLAECLEISSKLDIDPQKEIINSKKPENDEEARALFHVIADKKILSSNNDQEPNIINIEKDQEAAFHTIKNYFTPKKTIETQAAINLLLDKGVNHSQIAAKVGVSQASIYRLASLKKNS
jgi:DNA-directed RNA polymerase specialized sigma subunit